MQNKINVTKEDVSKGNYMLSCKYNFYQFYLECLEFKKEFLHLVLGLCKGEKSHLKHCRQWKQLNSFSLLPEKTELNLIHSGTQMLLLGLLMSPSVHHSASRFLDNSRHPVLISFGELLNRTTRQCWWAATVSHTLGLSCQISVATMTQARPTRIFWSFTYDHWKKSTLSWLCGH